MLQNDLQEIVQTQQKILEEIEALRNGHSEQFTFGERCADWFSRWIGSWKFILGQALVLLAYVCYNLRDGAFDVYPFIFLNLILSFQAAFAVPIILMSQNRQEEKDRLKALAAYKTIENVESLMMSLDRKVSTAKRKQENGDY